MNNAGKGDTDRTTDRAAYREGYEAINWRRKPKFTAKFVHAPKVIKPDDTVAIRHLNTPCYICHQIHADA